MSALDSELMKLQEIRGGEFVVKSVGAEFTTVEGLASTPGLDRDNDRIELSAMEAAIAGYMRNPLLIWYHKWEQILGQVESVTLTPQGPWVVARVERPAPGSPLTDIYEKIRRGVVRAFSIGAKFQRRSGPDGTNIITAMDWRETSICPVGKNAAALFTPVVEPKALAVDLDAELASLKAMRRGGLDRELAALRKARRS